MAVDTVTRIQQILWKLEMDYLGHPYYVSGNAIYHALASKLDAEVRRQLHVSHGMFVPGAYGSFPEAHSQSGSHPSMGASLQPVDAYEDLFLFRRSTQPWLLDSQPRDALNTHDVRLQSGNLALSHEMLRGRPPDAYRRFLRMSWYVQAYVSADDPSVLPLGEAVLDGLQFGGKRNYGYGHTSLKDTQVVDLSKLDYRRLATADEYVLEFVSPVVLKSEFPGADDFGVPWWWSVDDSRELRRRGEQLVEGGEVYRLETVDHGQVVGYGGNRPIETAKNGVRRVGTHRKFGFGEVRVRPAHTEEV